ncbi:hypothetical protein BS78_07G075500 [Paspalum vaginatum]|nr:hypothetical protein BS78_07G075500 [Paspalum vaginatum]
MPSSSASRRRRRNKHAPPATHQEAAGPAGGPAPVPRLPPPAAFARRPDPSPDAAAVEWARGPAASPRLPPPAVFARKLNRESPPNPNPSPSGPQARPPMPPPSSSASSSRRGRGGGCGRGRKKDEAQEVRDWAALPLDAITAILGKLDHIEILLGPGKVCRSWRRAARDEPALWRRIDMRGHPDLDRRVNLYGMAQAAIRRARGQCEAFWAEYAADDDVLHLLGDEAPSLKSLRLICCQDIIEFEDEIKKFPLLEELEISLFTNIGGKHVFEEVGKACPELKHFRFNRYRFYSFGNDEYSEDDDSEFNYNKDDDALGIANMHGLHSLQLFGHSFTNEGLAAILDNCPHLESLDIRHCFNIVMDDALQAKCAAIKTLRLPYDSMDDYDLQFEGPIWSLSGLGIDSDSDDCFYGGPDYILDSDEYDDYCDPLCYLDGVYESELGPEDRMFLKGMRALMRDDDDDDY